MKSLKFALAGLLLSAMPAMAEALCILPRVCRHSPFTQAVGRYWNTRSAAFSASASVKSPAERET